MKPSKILCALIIAATAVSVAACAPKDDESAPTDITTKKTEETVTSEQATDKIEDKEVDETSGSAEGTTVETLIDPAPTQSEETTVEEDVYEESPMDAEYAKNKMIIVPVEGTEYEDIEELGEKYGFYIEEVKFDQYIVKTNDPLSFDELNELSQQIDKEDIVDGCYLEFKATFG